MTPSQIDSHLCLSCYYILYLSGTNVSFSHPLLLLSLTAESLALWGFQGSSSPPPWVSLQAGHAGESLGLQERYLPLGLEAYGCSPHAAQTRKDLELLKKATGLQWPMWTIQLTYPKHSCTQIHKHTHNQLMNVNCWTFNLLTMAKMFLPVSSGEKVFYYERGEYFCDLVCVSACVCVSTPLGRWVNALSF